MKISISDKKEATKAMILDIFKERVERFELYMQEQISKAYMEKFKEEIVKIRRTTPATAPPL